MRAISITPHHLHPTTHHHLTPHRTCAWYSPPQCSFTCCWNTRDASATTERPTVLHRIHWTVRDGLRDTLRDGLRDTLRDTFRDGLRDTFRDGLRDTDRDTLRDGLRNVVRYTLRSVVRDTLRDTDR